MNTANMATRNSEDDVNTANIATRNSEDDVCAVSTEQKTTTKQDLDCQMNVQPLHTLTHTHARARAHSISLIMNAWVAIK